SAPTFDQQFGPNRANLKIGHYRLHAPAKRRGGRPRPNLGTRDARSLMLPMKATTNRQLFTLMVTGSESSNLSGVSARSLMSFFPVRNATAVPAPAPTGPPISAPVPPPASAPITVPPAAPPPIHSQLRFLWSWPTFR